MQHKLSDLNGAIRGGSNSSSRANSTEGLTLQVSTGVENNGDNDADDDDIIDEGDDQQQKHRQLDNQSPFTLLPIQPSSDILISGRNNVSGRVGGGGGISSCSLSDLWLDPDDMEVDDGDDREQHGKSDQQTPSTLHRFTSKSFRQINLCVKNDDNVDDDDEVAMGNDDETTSKPHCKQAMCNCRRETAVHASSLCDDSFKTITLSVQID
ncbi:unnamed protein product [Trichobilharzia regenti]|nr:unnamed protein product [Trichobilharzia regenti]